MVNLSSRHYVDRGRWAYTAVPRSPEPDDETCTNAYRLLRSPWNSISDPFVTRSKELLGKPSFANFPGCDVWHRAFVSPTLAEVLQIMNGAAHGPVHIMVGGQWSTNETAWVDDFWGETITDQLARDMKAAGTDVLVNLASNEYFKSVHPKRLPGPVIEPVFQDEKNGQYKVISFYAKKARGLMAAWILRKGIDTPAGLKKFREAGYRYDKEASTDSRPVFRRGEQ